MEELINQWKELNKKANRLLNKHKSFRDYNNVRLQMDKIEDKLYELYNVSIEDLWEVNINETSNCETRG